MPSTTTLFDIKRPYLYTEVVITHPAKGRCDLRAIIDTGAPRTEFADAFLAQAGFIEADQHDISLKAGLQTQRHGKLILPFFEVCGQALINFEVMVSRFEKSWGIAALIGLDFFRKFKVTIDYKTGQIVSEPY